MPTSTLSRTCAPTHRNAACHQTRRSSSLSHPYLSVLAVTVIWMCDCLASTARAQVTNPLDKEVLYDVMYSMNYEFDWRGFYTDPCISGPQGIGCQPDSVTGVYYVTQMEFGFISPTANIIPCSENATIPPSIFNLTRLDTLLFYNCFMNDTVSIPEEISELGPSLRLLTFSNNPGLAGSIPSGFGNLTGLQRLILARNCLEGSIPDELGNLRNLMQLDFSHNLLTGSVPGSLGALSNLVILDLRYNQLDGEFPAALSAGMGSLQRLAMSYNRLQGSLPDTFTGLQALTFLDLSFNNVSGVLPQTLGRLCSLQDLFLNANSIGGELPDALSNLTNLVRLDLSASRYVGSIPSSFKYLTNLRYLGLSDNRLTGDLPAALASLPHIFTLNLDGNLLSGPVPFPPSFVQKMGQNLHLRNNPGLCYTSVPESRSSSGVDLCPNSSSVLYEGNALPPGSPAPLPSAAYYSKSHLERALLFSLVITILSPHWWHII